MESSWFHNGRVIVGPKFSALPDNAIDINASTVAIITVAVKNMWMVTQRRIEACLKRSAETGISRVDPRTDSEDTLPSLAIFKE